MKSIAHHHRRGALAAGFTFIEMMVSAGLGLSLMVLVCILFLNGTFSFIAMGNYQNLDAKSTAALDTYSKEIRNATAVLSYTSTVLNLTNVTAHTGTKLAYDSSARTLVMTKISSSGQTVQTNLTGCDSWVFSIYNRTPNFSATNITFGVTNAASCKLINMTWKCSRTILGSKLNTETVQTAQVVLRNKVN